MRHHINATKNNNACPSIAINVKCIFKYQSCKNRGKFENGCHFAHVILQTNLYFVNKVGTKVLPAVFGHCTNKIHQGHYFYSKIDVFVLNLQKKVGSSSSLLIKHMGAFRCGHIFKRFTRLWRHFYNKIEFLTQMVYFLSGVVKILHRQYILHAFIAKKHKLND